MFKRILAAVDDSLRSQLVMQTGRELAELAGGELVVLRVRPDVVDRDLITPRDAALADQTGALRAQGIAAHYLVHTGSAEQQILQTAQRQRSTLIIIASRQAGPRALPQRRMTARLAARAQTPLLVIPELGADDSSPSRFGAADATVLVALDGTPLAELALPYAAELAALLDRPLTLLRVMLPLRSQAELAQAWSSVAEARQRARERISRDLRIDTQVVTGAPVDELLWAVEGRHAGVLALSARGQSGLTSQRASPLTLEVLRRANIPALVIPTPVLAADTAAPPSQES